MEGDGGSAIGTVVVVVVQARDATCLPGCAKTYLPQPDGEWGMVFRFEPSGLVCIAFGERHPKRPWRPSVYQVAHYRLHGAQPPAP